MFHIYIGLFTIKAMIHGTKNLALKGILNSERLIEMLFPFPSIELQNQFVTFIKQTEKTKNNHIG